MTESPLHYLEIVTPDVDATRRLYAESVGVEFTEPDPALGGAVVAVLPGGSRIGIRAPMHELETPLVRVYVRVRDLNAAVSAAADAGGEVLLASMDLPGHGRIAIHRLGGIEHGLWQVG